MTAARCGLYIIMKDGNQMFDVLLFLYKLFSLASAAIMILCCAGVIFESFRKGKLSSSKLKIPSFTDLRPAYRKCCLSSTVFILMDWILFSGSYVPGNPAEGAGVLAKCTLGFVLIWSLVFLAVVLTEIAARFSENDKSNIRDAFGPVLFRAVICAALTYIIV